MAPTKEKATSKDDKEVKLTPEQSAALMLDYLRKQNRPYSATDISANLKNRVAKAAAAKILKDMHERGDIEGRAAGKQLVYHTKQEPVEDDDAKALAAMDAETMRLRDATTALKAEEKAIRQTLREDTAQVPLSEIRSTLAKLEAEKIEMTARLNKLKGGDLKPVSAKERKEVYDEYRKWTTAEKARSKIRREMWKEIEGMVGKTEAIELKEELGVEL